MMKPNLHSNPDIPHPDAGVTGQRSRPRADSPWLGGIIRHTLAKMAADIETKSSQGVAVNEQSSLVYMGNVHDAIPRRLLLAKNLSPLDKTAWMMIRLYAQQNDGAIFPTYSELQRQLGSPGHAQASSETVSHVLVMLRLTRWLSLCKTVRDPVTGRIRGNIYAQHDEPLTARDAEAFDPQYLALVERCCRHKHKSIRVTARQLLAQLRSDPDYRHQHSRLALIAERLHLPLTPAQAYPLCPASETEEGQRGYRSQRKTPVSESEDGQSGGKEHPTSETEAGLKSVTYDRLRKPKGKDVRVSVFNDKNPNTYDAREGAITYPLPDALLSTLSASEQAQVCAQLQQLPPETAHAVVSQVLRQMTQGTVKKPVAYLLSTLQKARNGAFTAYRAPDEASVPLGRPEPSRTATAEAVMRGEPATPPVYYTPPPEFFTALFGGKAGKGAPDHRRGG
ncbi:STY4528 family pathogenicity island replication protein [Serratia fonticola]|uniref:STY4528 family pathogenicity island replication protein n=1 Tax=Serratia fonticola TaxID=47917 RepID=UPI0013773D8E|nr:STY4528 family pathogenicity island replication protein [Serratia fonticola]NCG54475.1 helix-turn-helix domain-containing protein [Serratia fonticola]